MDLINLKRTRTYHHKIEQVRISKYKDTDRVRISNPKFIFYLQLNTTKQVLHETAIWKASKNTIATELSNQIPWHIMIKKQ